MRYIAAYLLARLGNKENPSQTDVENILSSVGIEVDAEKLKRVINELKDKNIEDLIIIGLDKLHEYYSDETKPVALNNLPVVGNEDNQLQNLFEDLDQIEEVRPLVIQGEEGEPIMNLANLNLNEQNVEENLFLDDDADQSSDSSLEIQNSDSSYSSIAASELDDEASSEDLTIEDEGIDDYQEFNLIPIPAHFNMEIEMAAFL